MGAKTWVLSVFAGLSIAACDSASDTAPTTPRGGEWPIFNPPAVQRVPAPLAEAYCDVNVTGTGVIDLEVDYLPGVVTCENGGANLEALKAQAIAARSVAYYNMATQGEICDSQGCQVFSCGSDPLPEAIQAVQETSGMYLMYSETLTYGFYVAGDNNTSGPGCVGVSGSTEQWVTYNDGQSGTDVEQTELGLVIPPGDPSYGQNRGCMGQWGARCLENDNGADYLEILRFYYGEDIEVVQAEGDCVLPVETTAGESDSAGDTSGGASTGGETGASTDPTTDPTNATDPTASDDSSTGVGGGTGASGGESGDDSSSPTGPSSAGTSDSSLPDGFGEDATNSACNCTSGEGGLGATFGLGIVLLGLRRRRRT